MIERSRVRVPVGLAGDIFSLGWTFCADSQFGIRRRPPPPPPPPPHFNPPPPPFVKTTTTTQSFCQKCRNNWTRMHPTCVTWHGSSCMVYTERAETAAVSRGTSHVTAKRRYTPLRWIFKTRYTPLRWIFKTRYTPLRWIFKTRYTPLWCRGYLKRAVEYDSRSFRITCNRGTLSLLESGE